MPMDAFTHGQLTARSRREHTPGASNIGHHQPSQSRRALLTPSRQSALTTTGLGILLFHPTGYSIDAADLRHFFMEAHSNTNVTGGGRMVCLPQPQSAAVEPDSNNHGPPLLSLLVPNVSQCAVCRAKAGPRNIPSYRQIGECLTPAPALHQRAHRCLLMRAGQCRHQAESRDVPCDRQSGGCLSPTPALHQGPQRALRD